jgi:hypothetical protein
MKSLVEIKQGLVYWGLNNLPLTSLLASTNGQKEVREIEWQGTKFSYPCVRVRVNKVTPTNTQCSQVMAESTFLVFSETPSSIEADTIASTILLQLHGKSFSVPSGTHFGGIQIEQFGADRTEDNQAWMSKLNVKAIVS